MGEKRKSIKLSPCAEAAAGARARARRETRIRSFVFMGFY
jgi:hypothetical protein